MSEYTKHVWASGELITSTLLNHIEDQLALTAHETYILKCTVANGVPTFAWQSA